MRKKLKQLPKEPKERRATLSLAKAIYAVDIHRGYVPNGHWISLPLKSQSEYIQRAKTALGFISV